MKKKNSVYILSVVILIAVLAFFVFSYPSINKEKSDLQGNHILGNPDAPITLIEYSDYECPFCTRFYTQTLPQLKKDYIDSGKVKLIYKDFPLDIHNNAKKAAEAAECAGEQQKYYEMHNLLFERGVSGGVSSFKEFAKQLNLDINKFNDCLDSGKFGDEVQGDFEEGRRAGVSGTPTFFLNGKIIVGAQPFEAFKQIIDSEINSQSNSPSEKKDSGENKEFKVKASRFQYEPSEIKVNRGDKVRIIIENIDTLHGIRIPELGISGADSVEFTADKSGEFVWYCNAYCGSGHGGMQGKLIVE